MKTRITNFVIFAAIFCFVAKANAQHYGDPATSSSGVHFVFQNCAFEFTHNIAPLQFSWGTSNALGQPLSGQSDVIPMDFTSINVTIYAPSGAMVNLDAWCIHLTAMATPSFPLFNPGSKDYCASSSCSSGCFDPCFPSVPDDQEPPPKLCQSCCGMPAWSVSEPYMSLWINDEPLGYQPTIGSRIAFDLSFKQRESKAGFDTSMFSAGKKWNFSWLSYVDESTNVLFSGGGFRSLISNTDYLSNARLSGNKASGFTIAYPDGSKDVYGFIITNQSGAFLKAFLSERWNTDQQKTTFNYANYTNTSPVIRLLSVVDGDGRSTQLSYATGGYSTNLISQVTDAFGRTTFLTYDSNGQLTNCVDVQGLTNSFVYDGNGWITNMTTPYGKTVFTLTDSDANELAGQGRSVLVTQPDGGHHFYLNDQYGNPVYSYPSNSVPNTAPFANTLDNTTMSMRNTFYWGPMQYQNLMSHTNAASMNSSDFLKARMKHWLARSDGTLSLTCSLERGPSPDADGNIEGIKTWYDYADKSSSPREGDQSQPLFIAQVLPDGSTHFVRTLRNSIGAVTNEISTYSISSGGATFFL